MSSFTTGCQLFPVVVIFPRSRASVPWTAEVLPVQGSGCLVQSKSHRCRSVPDTGSWTCPRVISLLSGSPSRQRSATLPPPRPPRPIGRQPLGRLRGEASPSRHVHAEKNTARLKCALGAHSWCLFTGSNARRGAAPESESVARRPRRQPGCSASALLSSARTSATLKESCATCAGMRNGSAHNVPSGAALFAKPRRSHRLGQDSARGRRDPDLNFRKGQSEIQTGPF